MLPVSSTIVIRCDARVQHIDISVLRLANSFERGKSSFELYDDKIRTVKDNSEM